VLISHSYHSNVELFSSKTVKIKMTFIVNIILRESKTVERTMIFWFER